MGVCVSGANDRTPQNRNAKKNERNQKTSTKSKEPPIYKIKEKLNSAQDNVSTKVDH